MALPESLRGLQHRGSKVWELIDSIGNHITVTNLRDWARSNYTIFEPACTDVDKAARRVYNGFSAIASSMRGVRSRKRPVYQYKGWKLAGLPRPKEDVHDK